MSEFWKEKQLESLMKSHDAMTQRLEQSKERKPSEILRAAKALISTPETWITKKFVEFDKVTGVCKYCSIGALDSLRPAGYTPTLSRYAKQRTLFRKAHRYLEIAAEILSKKELLQQDCQAVAVFNDNHTHEEVMKMWDMAIQLAEDCEQLPKMSLGEAMALVDKDKNTHEALSALKEYNIDNGAA